MYTTTETQSYSSYDTRASLSSVSSRYAPGAPFTPIASVTPIRPGTAGLRVISHDGDHGFCTVCGSVWPCARARRDQLAAECRAVA
jgi:hypothetical protein